MTGCCAAADGHFGPARTARELAAYHRRGPTGPARLILDVLRDANAAADTMLDIGAGIGVLHHELLGRGVRTAIHVEGAAAYIAAARAETERRGHAGRVEFLHGDAVVLAAELPPADLVTLDRVVCCYPDFAALLHATTRLARRYYALSYPHDRWYMRAHTAWQNYGRRRAGNPFRTFVHPPMEMRDLIEGAGFRPLGWCRSLLASQVRVSHKDCAN